MTFIPPDDAAAEARARLDEIQASRHQAYDEPTPLSTLIFGFQGRLGRPAYFGCNVVVFVCALPLMVFGASVGENGAEGVGLTMIVAGAVVLVCGTLALTIKRLHDIGMSGAHAFWIYAIILMNGHISEGSGMGLIRVGVALWLLFMPGQPEDNEYGPAPGMESEE